jgi:CheY-like chemotaxis protein
MIVLHVDDDKDDREILFEALKEINPEIELLTAEDGVKAFNLLKDGLLIKNLNYIFLDVIMPVMDGVALLALIKGNQKLSKVPVYVYTNTSNPKEIEHIKNLGAEFIQKKSDCSALVSTLKHVLKPQAN